MPVKTTVRISTVTLSAYSINAYIIYNLPRNCKKNIVSCKKRKIAAKKRHSERIRHGSFLIDCFR